MALQTMELDPNAQAYTDNEIVDKINSATNAITRDGSLDQDSLGLVLTAPGSGDYFIKFIQRGVDGKLQVVYDDVPAV